MFKQVITFLKKFMLKYIVLWVKFISPKILSKELLIECTWYFKKYFLSSCISSCFKIYVHLFEAKLNNANRTCLPLRDESKFNNVGCTCSPNEIFNSFRLFQPTSKPSIYEGVVILLQKKTNVNSE